MFEDKKTKERLETWIEALLADGWTASGIYTLENEYKESQSAQFERDGFKVQVYRMPEVVTSHISAWGPDKVSIPLPQSYDFTAMQAALRTCGRCGRVGVDTTPVVLRVARRVCAGCMPTAAELLEPHKCE